MEHIVKFVVYMIMVMMFMLKCLWREDTNLIDIFLCYSIPIATVYAVWFLMGI